jgi:transposase
MPTPYTILPDTERLHLLHLATTDDRITAVVETIAAGAPCPQCGQLSRHVHSRYTRSVADLPWNGVPFRLRLHARRFFCDQPTCPRHIFTERLPGLVASYGRRTQRLETWLCAVGFALGGEAGARLLRTLGLASSAATLLRQVRSTPDPEHAVPHTIGVDDWCFLRGRRYGAIVVDLERRCALDLLPDREAQTFASWLSAHPGIAVISRDRGSNFADGATRGAPNAIQVADRFHILKNVVEAFQQALAREHTVLRAAAEAVLGAPPLPSRRLLTAPERSARASAQARRQERYQTVHHLRALGKTIREIAGELRMGQNTVQRLLRAESCPLPARHRTRTTLLSAFESYLRERWNRGEQNGQQLLREIRAQGYCGGQSTLYGLLGRWRRGPRHSGPYARQTVPASPVLPALRTSPRAVSWQLLRPPRERTPLEHAYVETVLRQSATIATMTAAVTSFFDLLHERRSAELDDWVTGARASRIPELAGFAEGIRRDYSAIRAAFDLPWSQGQVEGQVNRLKLLKRQMYGRANLDLLRRRVLGQPATWSA